MNDDFLIENVSIFASKIMVKIKNVKFIVFSTIKKMNNDFLIEKRFNI